MTTPTITTGRIVTAVRLGCRRNRAIGRLIWRRSTRQLTNIPAGSNEYLLPLDQGLDADFLDTIRPLGDRRVNRLLRRRNRLQSKRAQRSRRARAT